MKKLILLTFSFLVFYSGLAQQQKGFNYQAVIRNADGQPIASQDIGLRIKLIGEDSKSVYYTETHSTTTSPHGVVSLVVGEGDVESGVLEDVPWSVGEIYMKVEIDPSGEAAYSELGTVKLNAVPYALFAVSGNQGPQGDPGVSIEWLGTFTSHPQNPTLNQAYYNSNEGKSFIFDGTHWQQMTQDGASGSGSLPSGTAGQSLVNASGSWIATSNIFTGTNGNVGFGTTTPEVKLDVVGDIRSSGAIIGKSMEVGQPTAPSGEPLFVVRNSQGLVVFAVYESGVRVYVDSDNSKSSKGGFAIGGLTPAKESDTEYFRVTPDSVRIYIENESKSGSKGGFAIGGLTPAKGVTEEYLRVTRDSSRIYVNTDAKGKSGSKGGFAIGGLTPAKENQSSFMYLTSENYFIGHESGKSLTSGYYNSVLGYQSGLGITNGYSNSFMGYQSGYSTNTGSGNLFLGYQTGYSNQSGNFNTFVGYRAGYSNTSGKFNTFLGSFTGFLNQTGNNNTFVGDSAGYKNTGSSNSFFGTKTGLNNTTGAENVFIGNMSGYKNTSGLNNVFVGNMCGYKNSTGNNNVYIGNKSGHESTSAQFNVFIGQQAGYNSNTNSNVLIGYLAGRDNNGGQNVIIGREVGVSNAGSYNVMIGDEAGFSNTTGERNVFIGRKSGYSNTWGHWNVFIGQNCGASNTFGQFNTFLGFETGMQMEKGNGSVLIGLRAGQFRPEINTSVFIGRRAGEGTTVATGLLFIDVNGYDHTQALIYGEFMNGLVRINNRLGIGRSPGTNNLEVEGNASKTTAGDWAANSDRRIKTDILDIENAAETVLKLRPVMFKYTSEWMQKHPSIENRFYYNFIAQEYQQVFPESVNGSGEYIDGDADEVLQLDSYNAQIVSIKAVQELILENRKQQEEIDALKAELEAIKVMLRK